VWGGLDAGSGPSACQGSVLSKQCTCLCSGTVVIVRLGVRGQVEAVFGQDGVEPVCPLVVRLQLSFSDEGYGRCEVGE